jgi:DNA-binding NarL/FixJ family response regulator
MNEFQKLEKIRQIIEDPFGYLSEIYGISFTEEQRISANMAASGKTLQEIAERTVTSIDTAGGRIKAVSAKLEIKKSEFPAVVWAMIETVLN